MDSAAAAHTAATRSTGGRQAEELVLLSIKRSMSIKPSEQQRHKHIHTAVDAAAATHSITTLPPQQITTNIDNCPKYNQHDCTLMTIVTFRTLLSARLL